MPTSPGDDPPKEERLPPDDEHEGAPEEENGEEVSPRSKKFRATPEEDLDPQSFLIADERAAVSVRLRGGSVAKEHADAHVVGGIIRRLARLLEATAQGCRGKWDPVSYPELADLRFGSSVTIDLEISAAEKLGLSLEGDPQAPTIRAAQLLTDLLNTPSDEISERVFELSPAAATAYVRVLESIATEVEVMEWRAAGMKGEFAVVTREDASRDLVRLQEEQPRKTVDIPVVGKLTMADSDLRRFALTLPSWFDRPPVLKGKKRIRGTYSPEIGQMLKTEQLWDSFVLASIRMTYDDPARTVTQAESTYELLTALRAPERRNPQLLGDD